MAKLARFQRTIQTEAGVIVPSAHIEVRNESDGALATLFSDRAGGGGITNPFDTGADGFAAFYVIGGAYKVRAYTGPSGSPTFERIWRHEGIGTAREYDARNLLFAFPISFSASGFPGVGEELVPYDIPLAMSLENDFEGWYMRVRVAPTAPRTIAFKRNTGIGTAAVQFATGLIDTGELDAEFTMAANIELLAGEQVWPVMPNPRDTQMEDVSVTLLARL